MGELFMQKPNGETTTFQIDGTVIKEMKSLEIDWCDACQKWQKLEGGAMSSHLGLQLIWLCEACK